MPTENERKYMLQIDCESAVAQVALAILSIRQAYVKGTSNRIRRVANGNVNYFFTFKCNNGRRVIEIEKKIGHRDFEDLWDLSLCRLEKNRYLLRDGWCVDFFLDHNDANYFAMAECEMPEGQTEPTEYPEVITNYLVHAVSPNDGRFTSKLVSDVRYATNLLKECSK